MGIRLRKIKSLSDRELLVQFQKNGNQEYLGALFQRYMPLVFGVCMKYFKNEPLAKDATMSIYEVCTNKLQKSDIDQFKGWLYVVTKNHCLMQLRKEKREIQKVELLTEKAGELNGYDFLKEEQIGLLLEKMDDLKLNQKKCLSLFFLKNKSYQQVASELNLEVKTVKSHIQNGKRNLRLMLQKEQAFKN